MLQGKGLRYIGVATRKVGGSIWLQSRRNQALPSPM